MAGNNEDNTRLNLAHTQGSIYADDAILEGDQYVKYQRIKLVFGPDGTSYGDVDYELPLPVLPSSHMYSKGNIFGHETLRKYGSLNTLPTTERFIEGGVTTEVTPYLPTAAVTVEAISTDANDTAAGTGAQQITIEGLDESFNRASETITMAGLSASTATTTTFIRVFRAYIPAGSVGTYAGNNIGSITIRTSGAGTRFISILAGRGQSQSAHYCVPAGMKYFIKDINITTESAKSTTIYLWRLEGSNDVTTPFAAKRIHHEYQGLAGASAFNYTPEIYIPAYTDIWASGFVTAATGAASVEFNGILETV